MAFSLLSKIPLYSVSSKITLLLSISYSTSLITDKIWDQIQKSEYNIERTMTCVKLDPSCVINILRRCSTSNSLLGLRLFVLAANQSHYRHSFYMYHEACKLLRIIQNPELLTDVFDAYVLDRCSVTVKTFFVILKLCKVAKIAKQGLSVFRKMQEFKCRPDTTIYNLVIQMFCESKDMVMAERLLKEMSDFNLSPDMITYIAIIKGFCSIGRVEDARKFLSIMKKNGCLPNVSIYSIILDGYYQFGSVEKAWEFLLEMEAEGQKCSPNVVNYTSMIHAFCARGRFMDAFGVLDHMNVRGCTPNRVTFTMFFNFLCAEERYEEARNLIPTLVSSGGVSNDGCYSLLLASLLRFNRLEEAEKLFKTMINASMKPDGWVCELLIKRFCFEGRVENGFSVYCETISAGVVFSLRSNIDSILLVELCEKGQFGEATKLASLMVSRGVCLKAPYVDRIVDHMKNFGCDDDLIGQLTRVET